MSEKNELEPHEPFEVFSDAVYFDMWALRPKGQTDFNLTLHFDKRHDAVRASYVIAEWKQRAQL